MAKILQLQADVALDCRNILGESIVWCSERSKLFWVDIEGKLFHEYCPGADGEEGGEEGGEGELRTWVLPERPGAVALKQDGGFVFALESGIAECDLTSGVVTKRFAEFEPDIPTTRMNDGRCDYHGRFVVGGMDEGGKALSAVYCLKSDGSVDQVIDGVTVTNSICFSTDGSQMYFADSPTRKIYQFDYIGGDRPLSNKRLFYEMPETDSGVPDGSTVDSEGNVWNAVFGGSRVVRHRASDGVVDMIVSLPVPNPTCVAFGGTSMDTLYITTARTHMSDEELEAKPTSGSLFRVKVPIKGVPEPKFKAEYLDARSNG